MLRAGCAPHSCEIVALSPQAKRTKEMLSANTEAPAIVEELAGGRDFRASVSRETLETLAGDWFQRAVAPLTSLLERNHLVRRRAFPRLHCCLLIVGSRQLSLSCCQCTKPSLFKRLPGLTLSKLT